MASVTLSGLSKAFGKQTVLHDLSLTIPEGSFTALLGPSGCGKTTILRLVAGFEQPSAGTVLIGGEPVADPSFSTPPEDRRLGMVFQAYALWPHMTVAENVRYPLRVRGASKSEQNEAVAKALATVGMADYGDRKPDALSGGQRQRVALARCLAMRPRVVLLDEPLANLDVHLRDSMQEEFRRLHAETGATMVYVTHDQSEAMALADQIAVLDKGVLQQVDTPERLYREPATEMVAEFIGRGVTLPVYGLESSDGSHAFVDIAGTVIRARWSGSVGAAPRLAVKREAIRLMETGTGGLTGTVAAAIYEGGSWRMDVSVPGLPMLTANHPNRLTAGDTVGVDLTDSWVL